MTEYVIRFLVGGVATQQAMIFELIAPPAFFVPIAAHRLQVC